jgi:rhodanese-related sulfurtransferase
VDQYLEYIANHPFLVSAAAALIGIIVAYEVSRAKRGFADVDPVTAPRLINHDDARLVDIRPKAEFDKGHILNAVNVPENELGDREQTLAKDADRPLIVYCGRGTGSGRAAARLVRAGCRRVYNLKGGLAAWENAGLPVKRSRK